MHWAWPDTPMQNEASLEWLDGQLRRSSEENRGVKVKLWDHSRT